MQDIKDSLPSSEKKHSKGCLQTCQSSKVTFKLFFFFLYTAIGSLAPFLALYFKQLGLDTGHAGIIVGLRIATEFIGAPVWGMIGDKFKLRKVILFGSLASFATGTLLFLAVHPRNQQCIEVRTNETKFAPLIFTSGGITLGSGSRQTFESNEPYTFLNNSKSSRFIRKNDETELNKIFLILLTIMLLGQIVGSAVYAMPDAIVVGFLEEKVHQYGEIRMWGEVGIAFGSFATGGMIGLYQWNVCGLVFKNYFISFYFFAGAMVFAMCATVFMKVNYSEQQGQENIAYFSLIKELLLTRNLIFVLVACVFGVFVGFHENFGLWYLDDLGAKPYVIGLAAGLRYTAASMGYLSSSLLLNRFGIERPIAVCLLLYSAVFMGLSFVQQSWLGVALYSVQGVLYGFGWSSCVVFGGIISLRTTGLNATIQGVIGGFHWGLGYGGGTTISGLLINMIGIPNMYFVYSVTSVLASLIIFLVYCLKKQGEIKEVIDEGYKLVPANQDSGS